MPDEEKNVSRLGGVNNNTNAEQNTILTITNTNPEIIISKVNYDTDDKINAGILGVINVLCTTFRNTDIESIADGFNNNIDDKINANMLSASSIAIKKIEAKPIADRANNNIDTVINIDVLIGKIINTTNTEFTVGGLYRTNTIVEKEIYESNSF